MGMRGKLVWGALGFFLGAITYMNVALKDIKYRISFYGYARKGDQVIPVIKLRKAIFDGTRHPSEWGKELEIATIGMTTTRFEFNDKDADKWIRSRYCE